MSQNENELLAKLEETNDRIYELERKINSFEIYIDIKNIFGNIKTITAAAELANVLANEPNNFYDQIFIDSANSLLYIYDKVNKTWENITINP